MTTIWILAGKEIRDGLRNRWIAATILALAGLALTLAFLGSAPVGSISANALSVTVVSLSSLSVYLLPLIALMLAHDALVGELERGTLLLLLSYPVARWQIVLGKFFGHLAILVLAILVGYGSAAVLVTVLGGADKDAWLAFFALCASSTLLGAVFLALGYLLSALCSERAKAAGLAIGLWLLLVVIYDLGLLGLLIADKEQALTPSLFTGLLIANPTDAFRVFNMTLFEAARDAGGLAGLGAEAIPDRLLPLSVLGAWLLAALAAASAVFTGGRCKNDRSHAILDPRGDTPSAGLRRGNFGRQAGSPGTDPRGDRVLLQYDRCGPPGPQSADLPGRAGRADLVLIGARRCGLHPAAGGTQVGGGDIRQRHGARLLGIARAGNLGRCG